MGIIRKKFNINLIGRQKERDLPFTVHSPSGHDSEARTTTKPGARTSVLVPTGRQQPKAVGYTAITYQEEHRLEAG